MIINSIIAITQLQFRPAFHAITLRFSVELFPQVCRLGLPGIMIIDRVLRMAVRIVTIRAHKDYELVLRLTLSTFTENQMSNIRIEN